ncbi:hypothetical protein LWI29_020309 [Acer saccharum]|uniref:beta-carotene 3-hydroxylase n=1 Tax=Acer saccharum TaxID=4024 RepID=A0AA39S2K8_ACESA|nr:hypothetical protein LWI29_020309 [Acer saccharum]
MATATSSSLVETYRNTFFTAKPSSTAIYSRSLSTLQPTQKRKKKSLSVCMVMEKKREDNIELFEKQQNVVETENRVTAVSRAEQRLARKRSERQTYLVAAIMSSLGISSMAVLSVYYRFSWQMEGGELQLVEMFGTFALSVGAAVGMEFWARWAHRALWHASLWHMHESHHRPREGPFELNDVFAITNALPAIALLSYGLFNKGLIPGLCFGAGLGITVFGMAYMFIHDGLVHRRFPVGPIADVPYLRRVAAAHQSLSLVLVSACDSLSLVLSYCLLFQRTFMRGIAALIPAKHRLKQIYTITESWGKLATSTPKKHANNDSTEGVPITKVKAEPIVAYRKPPPLPPVIGPLVALSMLETLSSRDGDDN